MALHFYFCQFIFASNGANIMDQLSQSLIAIFNGLQVGLYSVFSLQTLMVLVLLYGLAWLAAVEIEELDRKGDKPTIRLH